MLGNVGRWHKAGTRKRQAQSKGKVFFKIGKAGSVRHTTGHIFHGIGTGSKDEGNHGRERRKQQCRWEGESR